MNDRKIKRFKVFHRVVAVAVALFMVVSILPASESNAATYFAIYSGCDGNWYCEGTYKTSDLRKNPDLVPKSVTVSGGPALLYHIRSKGKTDFGTSRTVEANWANRKTHVQAATPSGTGTHESWTYVYALNKCNLWIEMPNNLPDGLMTISPKLVNGYYVRIYSSYAEVDAFVDVPTSFFDVPNHRPSSNQVELNAFCTDKGQYYVTSRNGANYVTLPNEWWLKDSVRLELTFRAFFDKFHIYGDSKGNGCAAEPFSFITTGSSGSFGLTPDYEEAADTYLTYHSNGGTGTAVKRGPYKGERTSTAAVEDNTGIGFSRKHYAFDGWNTASNGSGTSYDPDKHPTISMLYDKTLYAQWRQTEFQVTYDPNGADAGYDKVPKTEGWYGKDIDQNSFTVEDGNTEELPLKRTDMVFTGWNTKADGSGTDYKGGDTFTIDDTITEDITLYAQWDTAPKHYLNYDNGGETGTMASVTVYEDGIPANLVKTVKDNAFTSDKYTFLEWERDDADRTEYQPGDSLTFNMEKDEETLTARWGAVLTYNKNGNDVINNVPTDSKVYDFANGEKAKAQGNPGGLLRPKHIFSGWDDNAGDTSDRAGDYQKDDEITFTRNKIVYAHWRPATEYNVKYALNPPEDVDDSEMQGTLPADSHPYYNDSLDDSVTLRSPTMKIPGYRFDGWLDDKGDLYKPGKPYQITETTPKEIVFSAKWVPAQPYTVTYDANLEKDETLKSGSVPVDAKSPYYNDLIHDKIKVLGCGDMEREGYQFAGWNTERDGSGDSYAENDEFHVSYYSADITLYAQWKKELTVTGVTSPSKIYDGTASFAGKITFTGKQSGDNVSIQYTGAQYKDQNGPAENVGSQKTIELTGLSLGGEKADKYVIKGAAPGGTYSEADRSYETVGEITKRDITITPAAERTSITQGDLVPAFSYDITKGSLAAGDQKDEATFGQPQYSCVWEKSPGDSSGNVTLTPGSPASEVSSDYILSVSGLTNDNYNITFEKLKLTVNPPGSTPVHVTYKPGIGGQGTPPSDTNTYYTYDDPSMNSEAAVAGCGALYNSGCIFAGWNTQADGSGTITKTDGSTTKLLQPGDRFRVTADTTLYAVWKGNTPLTITGLTNKQKVYDGTADWNGQVTFNKALTEDEVSITWTDAAYDTKDAGAGKKITLKGITLTGKDAYKYKLIDGGMYSKANNTITINSGEITKRPIMVLADAGIQSLKKGDPIPVFGLGNLKLADGSVLGAGDVFPDDFGTPVFTCTDAKGNPLTNTSEAGKYTLSVSGLSNNNYDIAYKSTDISLIGADGKSQVQVTYNLNGGIGVPPTDRNSYYTYTDTSKNDSAEVLAAPGTMARPGCRFAGWNVEADGSGVTVKTDGMSTDRLMAGDRFVLHGNTVLYAVWKPDTRLTIAGLTNTSKVYDNSDTWNGKLELEGVIPGDDVKAVFANGRFSSKTAGKRFIYADNVELTGTDAYKYYLAADSKGLYDPLTGSLTFTDGGITKRPIVVEAQITGDNPVKFDADEPSYAWQLLEGTYADGEGAADIDASGAAYTLKDREGNTVLWEDIEEAGSYYVRVSGLENDNYDITSKDALLRVYDDEKTPAYVIYHADDATSGTVPTDNNEYMVYADALIEKPQATVLNAGDLERSGYRFAGWKDRAAGRILQPGRKVAVEGMTHLEAVWEGDTVFKITGLTNREKVYDGKEDWTGDVITEGILPGDDLKVSFAKGSFSDKNTGIKALRAGGITISGRDKDKYILEDTEEYDKDSNEVIVNGKIDPLPLAVQPLVSGFDADEAVIKQGDVIPPFELYLPASSRIINPDELKDFGEPVYKCVNYKGESLSPKASPGYYRLSVDGLSHHNYDVQAETSLVQFWAPGMKHASVTYQAGGGYGAAPIDKNDYAVFDDPSLNSMITVLANTFCRDGYRFAGWSLRKDGKGKLLDAGSQFRIMGDTVLYAVWEKETSPVTPGENERPDRDSGQNTDDNRKPDGKDVTDVNSPDAGELNAAGTITAEEASAAELSDDKMPKDISGESAEEKGVYSFGSPKYSGGPIEAESYLFEDEKVPLGQGPENIGTKPGWWNLGAVGDCLFHWIVLFCSFIILLYTALRRRHIKKHDPDESFILDKLVPLCGYPLGIIFYYNALCILDIAAIVLLLALSTAGVMLIKRAHLKNEEAGRESSSWRVQK